MAAAHLEKLNDRQRAAVEHGVGLEDGKLGGPLLNIAGAGSGKTNTLAHRVAHLIVNNADPRRILLMTFSRRAASEMARRVERICARVLDDKAHVLAGGLTWAGTFHGIGARILREHAGEIGLDPQFTIHDREDSADAFAPKEGPTRFLSTTPFVWLGAVSYSIYMVHAAVEASVNLVLRVVTHAKEIQLPLHDAPVLLVQNNVGFGLAAGDGYPRPNYLSFHVCLDRKAVARLVESPRGRSCGLNWRQTHGLSSINRSGEDDDDPMTIEPIESEFASTSHGFIVSEAPAQRRRG